MMMNSDGDGWMAPLEKQADKRTCPARQAQAHTIGTAAESE